MRPPGQATQGQPDPQPTPASPHPCAQLQRSRSYTPSTLLTPPPQTTGPPKFPSWTVTTGIIESLAVCAFSSCFSLSLLNDIHFTFRI